MTPEEAVVSRLTTASAVVALVGTRVYPLRFPRTRQPGDLPAVVYQRISNRDPVTQDGRSGLERPRVQIDAYAATYSQAVSVAEAVKAALHGQQWLAGADYAAAFFDSDRDGPQDPDVKTQAGASIERRSADYFVWFRKAGNA